MMKFIIIFLAIVVGIILVMNYVIGAMRRFLGITPAQKTRFSWNFSFGGRNPNKRGAKRQKEQGQVLYRNDDVVVLSGESDQDSRSKYEDLRDASFTEKKEPPPPKQ